MNMSQPTFKRGLDTSSFIEKAIVKHGNLYDYSETNFCGSKTKVKVICSLHGAFMISPYNHISQNINNPGKCPQCANKNRGDNNPNLLIGQDVIHRCREIHNNYYSYNELVDIRGADTILGVTCPKHGIFNISVHRHLHCKNGCSQCSQDERTSSIGYSEDEFISLCKIKHNYFYDYSKTSYSGCYNKVDIICPKHGDFNQVAHGHLYGYGCPRCGSTASKYEDAIKWILDRYNIEYTQRSRKEIYPLELDFYIPSKKLAIEVNGLYWHSELKQLDRLYHINKKNLCQQQGINLLQYTDVQIKYKYKTLISQLKTHLNINKRRLYGRRCVVRYISKAEKKKFLNKYHIQNNDKSNIDLGLFYKNHLVSVMTFCKPRIALSCPHTVGSFELSRYCCINNFTIIGGAAKLLAFFERNHTPERIITYADRTRSFGAIYDRLGFIKQRVSPPNYWYFKGNYINTPDSIYHRYNFRKNVLHKKLDNFNPLLTEWDNMKVNGWNRYWDCGSIVYIKQYNTTTITC